MTELFAVQHAFGAYKATRWKTLEMRMRRRAHILLRYKGSSKVPIILSARKCRNVVNVLAGGGDSFSASTEKLPEVV
jgi:hypothetical protein